MGGLSKKAFQLNLLRSGSNTPSLTLDGGALLFKNVHIPPGQLQQNIITARGIVEAYNLMAYDAVGISGRDLAAGLDFLLQMQAAAKFPWLSANLVRKTTGNPLFTPYIEKKIGDLHIGIVGLTGMDAQKNLGSDDASIRPWQEILPSLLSSLSAKNDLIILLSGYSITENKNISETVHGLHLIIQSGIGVANFTPQLIDDSLLCQTGSQGKYLGVLNATWQPSKKWGVDNLKKLLSLKKNELGGITGRLTRYRSKSSEEALAANKGYQQLLVNLDRIQGEITQLESDMQLRQGGDDVYATFDNRFIAMKPALEDDKAVLALVENIKTEVNEIGRQAVMDKLQGSGALGVSTSPDNTPSLFAGYISCEKCHTQQTLFWQGTRHAAAYKTLVEDRQQYNLDCLPCHVTTALSTPDAGLLNLPPELQVVGCEICHGTGKIHAAKPSKDTITRLPAPETCLRCHTEDRDDNFIYSNKIMMISCPSS